MAILATTRVYVSANGSTSNGGRYDASYGGSKNYAILDKFAQSYSSVSTAGINSTTLVLPTGQVFKSDIVGNCIRMLSGTNFTVGDYMVTARTDDTHVVLDRSPTTVGTAGSAGTGRMGGSKSFDWVTDANLEALPAGAIVYVKQWEDNQTGLNNYVLSGAVSVANAGTLALPIVIEGWMPDDDGNPETPYGDDRPYIDTGTLGFGLGVFHQIKHLRFTGARTTNSTINLSGANQAINCEIVNTGTGSTPKALSIGTADQQSLVIGCDLKCIGGYAAYGAGASQQLKLIDCNIHDSVIGVIIGRKLTCLRVNIFNCDTGITQYSTGGTLRVKDCNFYSCDAGVTSNVLTTARNMLVVNSIFMNCGKGIALDSGTPHKTDYINYNCYYNNTQDIEGGLTYGPDDIQADPKFKSPDTGDFSLAPSSPCIAAGLRMDRQVGEGL